MVSIKRDVFDLASMVDFEVNIIRCGENLDDILKRLIPPDLISEVKAEFESWKTPEGSIYIHGIHKTES